MRKRKTIAVETVRAKVNRMLAIRVAIVSTDEKQALCSLLEEILMETGNYHGFRWHLTLAQAKAVKPNDPRYFDRYYF